MTRARVLISLGFVALALFLVALEGVFVREASAQADQHEAHRQALEQYATSTWARQLRDALREAEARLDDVEADPLRDERRLLLAQQGHQVLPRVTASTDRGLRELTAQVLTQDAPVGDAPLLERWRLVTAVRVAIDHGTKPELERTVRAVLTHATHYVLAPEGELATWFALLELLSTRSTPSRALLRLLVRDGLPGTRDLEGLQRRVLRGWSKLGPDDAAFACERLATFSARGSVEVDDFVAACTRGLASRLLDFSVAEGVTLTHGLLVETTGDTSRGVEVDAPRSLAELEDTMRERGLLQAGEALVPPRLEGPLASLTVDLRSPRFERFERERRSALRWKTSLVVVAFFLGALVLGAVWVEHTRRERFLEQQRDFVSTVSHELRTPLAAMRVMAETLERRLEGHPGAKDYPRRLVQTVDHLGALVTNLLSFNRIDKGRWALVRERVEVATLLQAVQRELEFAPVALVFEQQVDDGLAIDGDVELLELVVNNLVRNAWKYSQRSPPLVQLRGTARGDRVVLSVRDNGPGLTAAEQRRIFEPFTRLQRAVSGTGLGLALCTRIAALHGGAVRVAAASAEGSTFEVELPRWLEQVQNGNDERGAAG
jgi:two-component system, OmpR family, sensor histidine kinase SenX3